MDISLLIPLAAAISIVICIIFFIKSKQTTKESSNGDRPRPAPNRNRENVPRRVQVARNRGARLRGTVQNDVNAEVDEENEAVGKSDIELPDGKIGAKKRAKLEAKAEKKAAREAEEQLRIERKKKSELEEKERKELEEKERAEEKLREEEEKRAREDKERKEYEEYLKMKEMFSVEEEGFEEGEEGESDNLLQEFVNYIKHNKVVIIEDLAAHFKLKTQMCIDRIKDLQKDDILTGVIDDRGKFIYVSRQEMDAVAKFIRQRGRVTITELAENSNQLINLVPSPGQTLV
ncbi:DDRGK domain-containing protein 1 isoform X2 [Cylas formicarius]|uniref:DDRGK domain-containing protein 1 isoform X2 n=1 Tax=Cylas formicarius TaxID=197179 RepID=UPI00295884DB|nr:DDRGK domain-containing protein 1 isoform X2 [Cylas formicarius]